MDSEMPTITNKANGYSEYSFHSVAHFFKWHSTFNYRWSSPISGMVFRGHSLSSYELIPSAHRMDSQTNRPKILNYVSNPYTFPAHLSEYNLVEAEYETLLSFFRLANEQGLYVPDCDLLSEDYLSSIFYKSIDKLSTWFNPSFIRLAALAQHYGIPTRMLDWSFEFESALYFALEGIVEAKNTGANIAKQFAIWGVNAKSLMSVYDIAQRCPLRFIVPNYFNNSNIIGQKGLLSYVEVNDITNKRQTPFDTKPFDLIITDYLSSFNIKNDGLVLCKMVFPTENAVEELNTLQNKGTSAATIYPSYSGIAKKLTLDHIIRRLSE
mgnify:CR=1 FL=1